MPYVAVLAPGALPVAIPLPETLIEQLNTAAHHPS